MAVTWKAVAALAAALPDVAESTSYGTAALKVKGKLLARQLDAETMVIRASFEDRAALVDGAPKVFSVTPHYQNYPAVVVDLGAIDRALLGEILAEAHRFVTGPRRRPVQRAAAKKPKAKR